MDHAHRHRVGIESVSKLVKRHFELGERRSIVYAFLLFSWLSALLRLAVLMYMRWATERILSAAGEHFGRTTKLRCLKESLTARCRPRTK